MIGLDARLPDVSGNLSLAFARLIDPAEGAHAISRFSLLCLKVLTRSEYEHLEHLGGGWKARAGMTLAAWHPARSYQGAQRCSYSENLSAFSKIKQSHEIE
jgi:hypothetical protein